MVENKMTDNKETAEQKLLKMIEDSGGAQEDASVAHQKVAKKQNLLAVIKTLNAFMFLILIAVVAVLANEMRVGMQYMTKSISFSVKEGMAGHAVGMEALIPNVQRLSFYLAGVNRRNLFDPYEEKKVASVQDISEKNRQIAQRTGSFKLVGIAWLDRVDTASVMIEDTSSNITHFLMKGEKVGDVIVKTIYADSAVLGYEDEEIVIRYDKSQL